MPLVSCFVWDQQWNMHWHPTVGFTSQLTWPEWSIEGYRSKIKVIVVNILPPLILREIRPESEHTAGESTHYDRGLPRGSGCFLHLDSSLNNSIYTVAGQRMLTCSNRSMSCTSLTYIQLIKIVLRGYTKWERRLTLPRSWPDCAMRSKIVSICRDRSGLTRAIRDTLQDILSDNTIRSDLQNLRLSRAPVSRTVDITSLLICSSCWACWAFLVCPSSPPPTCADIPAGKSFGTSMPLNL